MTPSGEAYRNLKPDALKEHGASAPAGASGSAVFARGKFATGAQEISKAQFNRLFREVTGHLSDAAKLYVHDGAVGSASPSDARTRVISDTPGGALALAGILSPAPTRSVAAADFPLTVYAASEFSSPAIAEGGFVAVDYDASAVVIVGPALGDEAAVKQALRAAAEPLIAAMEGVPLAARLVSGGGELALVLSLSEMPLGRVATVVPDAGVTWTPKGTARLFRVPGEPSAPNLYKSPSAVVLTIADSTGAVPGISKLSPEQAAYYFLIGYDGQAFHPGYPSGPSGVDPMALAKKFGAMVKSTGVPVFLVNSHGGTDVGKMIEAAVSGSLPKGKKPAEAAVNTLRSKFNDFVTSKFGELPPEEFAP